MKNESFLYEAPSKATNIVVTVDHATNNIPKWLNDGDLGLSPEDMNRHIAYDVGALGVARAIRAEFDAHLLATQFSRLVIDPNRGEDDPTLIMKIYDRSLIPANRSMTQEDREARLAQLYRPYHARLGELLDEITEQGQQPIIIAIHSFTHQLRGRPPRPWHIGILSAEDRNLADPLLRSLEADENLVVGDNEPYKGALKGDTLDRHGILLDIPHALIEVRNDLIENEAQQTEWGQRLSHHLDHVFKEGGLR